LKIVNIENRIPSMPTTIISLDSVFLEFMKILSK
jgi:hypothetical protein